MGLMAARLGMPYFRCRLCHYPNEMVTRIYMSNSRRHRILIIRPTWSRDKPSRLDAGPVPLAVMVTPAMLLKAGCGKVTGVGPRLLSFVMVIVNGVPAPVS
jgi:hypothetical protein